MLSLNILALVSLDALMLSLNIFAFASLDVTMAAPMALANISVGSELLSFLPLVGLGGLETRRWFDGRELSESFSLLALPAPFPSLLGG
jgi:predicted transporter